MDLVKQSLAALVAAVSLGSCIAEQPIMAADFAGYDIHTRGRVCCVGRMCHRVAQPPSAGEDGSSHSHPGASVRHVAAHDGEVEGAPGVDECRGDHAWTSVSRIAYGI